MHAQLASQEHAADATQMPSKAFHHIQMMLSQSQTMLQQAVNELHPTTDLPLQPFAIPATPDAGTTPS